MHDSNPPPIQQHPSTSQQCADSDAGLTAAIEQLTAAELRCLKAEAEASGMADGLRALSNCVGQFVLRA